MATITTHQRSGDTRTFLMGGLVALIVFGGALLIWNVVDSESSSSGTQGATVSESVNPSGSAGEPVFTEQWLDAQAGMRVGRVLAGENPSTSPFTPEWLAAQTEMRVSSPTEDSPFTPGWLEAQTEMRVSSPTDESPFTPGWLEAQRLGRVNAEAAD